jgi:hypothetical protein
MKAWPISTRVNKPLNNDPEIIFPAWKNRINQSIDGRQANRRIDELFARIKAVMALEEAYLKAVWGNAPDPQWLSGISSRDFRLLVESLVVLFQAGSHARRTS